MATTPGGLPYPVGTDFVVDGDDAIRSLAVAVDTRPLVLARLAAASVAINPGAYAPLGLTGPGAYTAELRGGMVASTVDGTFTVPVAGVYRVSFGAGWVGVAGGTVRAARLDDGAATVLAGAFIPTNIAAAVVSAGSRLLRMNAGAKVRMQVYHDTAATLAVNQVDTFLHIEWAGV